jgi:signal transduction histidine kinase
MKSLRLRLTVWFGLSFLAVSAALLGLTYRDINLELHQRHWQKDYPDHPDWTLHGSYTQPEIDDVMEDLVESTAIYLIPLVAAVLVIGYFLARKSLRPIASVNEQLRAISPKDLQRKIELAEVDSEFRDLLHHINDLLSRLHTSFAEMSEYAAKVAHELRTPLMIMRLKLEQPDAKINPVLAEELQEELHRLTHVVDQSLLIAKAEQGRLVLNPEPFDLSKVLTDLVKDFDLLAAENERHIVCDPLAGCWLEADLKYFKQILHNLLTNCLKHGQGDIHIKLIRRARCNVLIIYNQKLRSSSAESFTRGLGMRVVNALVNVQTALRFRSRGGREYYAARISFPPLGVPPPTSIQPAPVGEPHPNRAAKAVLSTADRLH